MRIESFNFYFFEILRIGSSTFAFSLTTETFPSHLIFVVVLFGEALAGSLRFIITYVYMECGDMLLLFVVVI